MIARVNCRRTEIPIGTSELYSMRLFAALTLISLIVGLTGESIAEERQTPAVANASDAFFAGQLVCLEFTLKNKDAEKINRENRPYVSCSLVEKDFAGNVIAEFENVAIKLKGAAGSSQPFEEKPALTIRPDRFTNKQLFHDLSKFHLNNSVQDGTYLHEQICSELFMQARVPATRVTHARVWLNGRDVGLYVLKEGFDERFLARHFRQSNGNLYDGGFCNDINVDLEKDSGEGPDDFSDLAALREACQIDDSTERRQRLEELVDIDAFLSFVAMELMTSHWDGYSQNKNNYRVYFDPQTKKVHFFPPGMDQMFGDPGASITEIPGAMLASAVMGNPIWHEQFKVRVQELVPMFSPPSKLTSRIDVLYERLRPALASLGQNFREDHLRQIREFKERIVARAQSLEGQQHFDPPKPLEFDESRKLQLSDWAPTTEMDGVTLEEIEFNETSVLKIDCASIEKCIASWRKRVLLSKGRYRFSARVQTEGVIPIDHDDRGMGAGLRISGSYRDNHMDGTKGWKKLAFEFEIAQEVAEVVLVAELRARAGRVFFDLNSMELMIVR